MGRKLALLIANYTYEDEGLRGLTAPAHDAEALAEVLRDTDVYAVDTDTGRERWRFPTGGPVVSSPVVAHGVLYVGSDDTRLYAVRAAD